MHVTADTKAKDCRRSNEPSAFCYKNIEKGENPDITRIFGQVASEMKLGIVIRCGVHVSSHNRTNP